MFRREMRSKRGSLHPKEGHLTCMVWAHVAIGVIDIANDVLPIYSSGLVDGRLNDPASGLIPGLDEAECMFEEF